MALPNSDCMTRTTQPGTTFSGWMFSYQRLVSASGETDTIDAESPVPKYPRGIDGSKKSGSYCRSAYCRLKTLRSPSYIWLPWVVGLE